MKTSLRSVLTQVIKADDVEVLDYGDSGNFRRLWEAAGATFTKNGGPDGRRSASALKPRLIIVWTGTLSDPVLAPVNASDCITPLDWAATHAKHLGDDASQWSQVLLLDLRHAERATVPAVAFYHGMNPEHRGWLRYEKMTGLQEVLKWLNESATETEPDRRLQYKGARDEYEPDSHRLLPERRLQYKGIRDLFRRLFRRLFPEQRLQCEGARDLPPPTCLAEPPDRRLEYKGARDRMLRDSRRNLTEGGNNAKFDHHAISNVIGPMILRGGLPPTFHTSDGRCVESAHAPALKALLQAVELIDEAPMLPAAVQGVAAPAQPIAISKSMKGLHLALLDDQAHHGWASWLAEVAEPNTSLSWDTSPKLLIESLQQQLPPALPAPALPAADLRFKFVPRLAHGAEIPVGSEPILLLDLRLFAGRQKEECDFYRNVLLPIIKTHFLDREDLAWPALKSEDTHFKKAVQALEGETLVQESPDHIEVLTWLPRVIALADMSLPIVIFSSTGRRELVQAFAPYKNIITTFEKPRNFAGGESLRVSTSLGLQRALTDAKRILLARFVIRRLMTMDLTPLEEVRQKFQTCELVDVYHDESSDPNKSAFRVNSLVVGFQSSMEAGQFETNLSQHVRFYGHGCLPKRPPKNTPRSDFGAWLLNQWNTDIKTHCLGNPANPLPGTPTFLLATAAKGVGASTNIGEPTDLLTPNGLDNINGELLRLLWECLLVDVIGAIAGTKTQVRIYGATRDRAVTLKATNVNDARKETLQLTDALWARYGIDPESAFVTGDFDQQREETLDYYNYGRWKNAYPSSDDGRFSPPFKFCWKSLSADSFHSIVAHCVQARDKSPNIDLLTQAITTARGIRLQYGGKTKDPAAMHGHYLIDVLGSLINPRDASKRIEFNDANAFCTAADWAVRGFRDELIALLVTARHADAKRWGEALRGLCQLNSTNHGSVAIYLLYERWRKAASGFCGADFWDCVDQLNVR